MMHTDALQAAFADPHATAVCLLSDGLPDVPPGMAASPPLLVTLTISAIVLDACRALHQGRAVPVHTILFATENPLADAFLRDIASLTGGQYQYTYRCGQYTADPCRRFSAGDMTALQDIQAQEGFTARDHEVCVCVWCTQH